MDSKIVENRSKAFLGIGWAFPVQFSSADLQVSISTYEENVNQGIDLLLQTPVGGRMMNPDFGSGLQQFFFKEINETMLGDLSNVVKSTLIEYESRITVESVDAEVKDQFEGLINVTIIYTFNQTNTRHNYVFPFYINEGTNLDKT